MDSDGSNKWLSIASNVAVFVGLVLVAYEINQTQRQMEISELADAADDFTQSMQTLSESDSLAELLYLAETDYDSLDDFQRWRLFFLACSELFGYRNGNEWWVTHVRMSPRESTR